MNNILIFLCAFAALFTLNEKNQLAVYTLCLIAVIFNIIGDLIPASQMTYYYLAAGLSDLFIIYALSRFRKTTRLIDLLQRICIGFIVVNFISWVLYMLYVSYTEFILMYTVMYLGLLLTILSNGDNYVVGNNAMDSRRVRIFSNSPSSDYIIQTHQKERGD